MMARLGKKQRGQEPEPAVANRRLWVARISWAPLEPRYGQERVEFAPQSRLVAFMASDFEGRAPFAPSRTLVSRALFSSQTGLKSVSALDPSKGEEGVHGWLLQSVMARGDQEPTEAMWQAAIGALQKACGARAVAELPKPMEELFDLARSDLRGFRADKEALRQLAGASLALLEAAELGAIAPAAAPDIRAISRACRV